MIVTPPHPLAFLGLVFQTGLSKKKMSISIVFKKKKIYYLPKINIRTQDYNQKECQLGHQWKKSIAAIKAPVMTSDDLKFPLNGKLIKHIYPRTVI